MDTRRLRAPVAVFLALSLALAAVAAEEPASPQPRKLRVPMTVVHLGSPGFPNSVTPGAQATAVVRLELDAEGKITDSTLERSTRDRYLDRFALQHFRQKGLPLPYDTPLPATVYAPIRLAVDSDASVVRKSCAQFNADYAYSPGSFSQHAHGPAGMRVFWLAMAAYAPDSGISPELASRLPAAAVATAQTCAANPSANFFEVFTSHLGRPL